MARQLSETERRDLHARIAADSRRIIAEHLRATGRAPAPQPAARKTTETARRPPAAPVPAPRPAVSEAAVAAAVEKALAAIQLPAPEPIDWHALDHESWKAANESHWSAHFAAQDARRAALARG